MAAVATHDTTVFYHCSRVGQSQCKSLGSKADEVWLQAGDGWN